MRLSLDQQLSENAVFAPMTSKLTSFDPLDADQYQNIWSMRMLHLTPIEVSVNNRLVSQVLSSFSYDPVNSQIKFDVRKDRTFSDGSRIEAEDIAFTIARMAFTRPKFPVVSRIVGLQEWLRSETPLLSLPAGIAIAGETITISLDRRLENPLFRFSMEIFSIVPRRSIDPVTNKLKMTRPPTSGNYEIESESARSVVFRLRTPPIEHNINAPRTVRFDHEITEPNFSQFMNHPPNFVFAGPEFPLRMARVDLEAQGANVTWAPASYIAALQINPDVEPFGSKSCRRQFADTFRETVAQAMGDRASLEPGLFPRIVPGYLPPTELTPSNKEASSSTTNESFKGKSVAWRAYPKGRNEFFNEAIRSTAKTLKLELSEQGELDIGEAKRSGFRGLETAFFFGQTGFWALDPVGDVQMLFAPNMHSMLEPIWRDGKVGEMLEQVGRDAEPHEVESRMKEFNRYIVDQALFNVVGHFRFYFASTGAATLRDVPLAVQQPYAWQVFNVD